MTYTNYMTNSEWCEYFKWLDGKYATITLSPTHHDNRCPMHGKVRTRLRSPSHRANGRRLSWG